MKNKAKASSNDRNYGVDLLKIVSMLMIVILHILGNGGVLGACEEYSFKYCVALFLNIASLCAVNCYALVSGYVGLRSKRRASGLESLWLQVAMYSVVICAVFYFLRADVGVKDLIKSFLPVTFNQYWYFTAYFGMWFFIPLMNAAVQSMPKVRLGVCLLIPAVVMLPISLATNVFSVNGGYSLIWLCYLYLLGAYISKYELLKNVSAIKSFLVYVVCVALTFSTKFVIHAVRGTAGETFFSYVTPTF